jgi:hypothetical protein
VGFFKSKTPASAVSFADLARNLAEIIDDVLTVPRPRARRLELIAHHVRRAIIHGYRAAKTSHVTKEPSK